MNAWNIQQQSTSIKFRTLIKSNNYLHNEVDAIFEEAILFFDVDKAKLIQVHSNKIFK